MKNFRFAGGTAALIFCGLLAVAAAQDAQKPAYLDTSLPPEQRAADLVQRMTLEEKASQLVNQARAIPRLERAGLRLVERVAARRGRERHHRVPRAIGLAATFDRRPFTRWRSPSAPKAASSTRRPCAQRRTATSFEGLDFWAPNINIFRDPRWGRGQETYGEDPFLTARMGVAFVTGMQGDDPQLLPRDLHAQALRRAQRAGAHAPHRRRDGEQARRAGHLPARVPRRRDRGQGRLRDVRLQQHQRRSPPAPTSSCSRTSCAASGASRATWSPTAARCIDIFDGHHYKPTQAAGLGHQPAARHGQRVRRLHASR